MADNSSQWADPFAVWAEWTKSVTDFWQSSATAMQGVINACADAMRMKESRENAAVTAWNALLSGAFSPEMVKEMGSSPSFSEIAAEAAKSLIDGCVRLQEQVNAMGDNGTPGADFSSMKAQREVFQSWIEFHEREIQPLLKMPQVGLTRFYQEKMNDLFDRFNLYQAAVAEFHYLLCRPMETSLREMQKKMEPEKGSELSGDLKQYYAVWIKTLEGHYMELFRSPEWHAALSRLVDEAANFRVSRNEVMMDFMQGLPIPTHKEMDEVYKELYTLKKMVKAMAKKAAREQEVSIQ